MIIIIHSLFSFVAFIVGFLILINPKGTKFHKYIGWLFITCMIISVIFSFFIYRDSFSVIHIISLLVLIWILSGIYAVKFKPNNWLYFHSSSMGSVYISTIIAGVGVLVRKILLPGNTHAGYIASIFVAIILTYVLISMTSRYKSK